MAIVKQWALLVSAVIGLCALPAVSASSGEFEINQLCAEQSGCFAGDAAGFPVTLTRPGTYRLTSNLDYSGVANAETVSGIQVGADNVTINMGGFAITGNTACTGTPVVSCTPTGSGVGLDAQGRSGFVVFSGNVSGAGLIGVRCEDCRIEDVSASSNGFTGIQAVGNSVVRKSSGDRNFSAGIVCSGICEENTCKENRLVGMQASFAIATDNVSALNGDSGFICIACSLRGSLAFGNAEFGAEYSGFSSSAFNTFLQNTMGDVTGPANQLAPSDCSGSVCP